jgi:hypothetical protein
MRQLTLCACALVTLFLLCSHASAQGCAPVYGGHAASSAYYAPSYGYAAATITPSYYAPSYGYAASNYTPSYGGYGYGGNGYGGYGYRYNPGGLGGPYSGLGVRPGLGFGGFGVRR